MGPTNDFSLEQAAKAQRVFEAIDKRAGRDGVYLLVAGRSLCQCAIKEKCQYRYTENAVRAAVRVRMEHYQRTPAQFVDVRVHMGLCPVCLGRNHE